MIFYLFTFDSDADWKDKIFYIFLAAMFTYLPLCMIPPILGDDLIFKISMLPWDMIKNLTVLYETHLIYAIIATLVAFIGVMIFFIHIVYPIILTVIYLPRTLREQKSYAKSLNNFFGTTSIHGPFFLDINGYLKPRGFWISKEDNLTFVEIAREGCWAGPDCSVCKEKMENFTPNHEFEFIEGQRGGRIAKIFAVPKNLSPKELTAFLNLEIRGISTSY